MLSARAWEDLRQASRLAHAQGVTLFMHGVKIVPQERYVSKGDTTPSKPRAAATTLTTTERDGRKRQPTVPVGDARDQPSKRQQRSAQRLQDHREKQRAATVHARVHARWLSIVHRRWLHAVWTEHRLALSMQDTTTNECGANCAVNRHPPSPPKGGGKKEVARGCAQGATRYSSRSTISCRQERGPRRKSTRRKREKPRKIRLRTRT